MFVFGVQHVRSVWHVEPAAQPQVPPQPSLPQVFGRQDGVHDTGQSTTGVACRYANQLLTAVRPPLLAYCVTRRRTERPAATEGESVPVKRT